MSGEELDQLKSDPSVIRVYAQYTKLRNIGSGKYQGCCPLHQEKTASFTVFPDMRYTCFGCGDSNNIFALVAKMDNCDFKTAVEKVKKEVNGSWSETKAKVESVFRPVAEPKHYRTIPLSEFKKLEDALERSSVARQWLLKERGITYETARKLHLGFAQNIGKLAGQDGADIADKGWIAFPSIEGDKVVSIKYRSIVRKKPGGFARQPGMATALFNSEAISVFDPIYVVEGEFDCLVLSQAGLNCVSVPSAGAKLSPDQKDQLMRASAVFLAGDNDSAGQSSMDRLWKELGDRTYRLNWPEGIKDANECLLKHCGGDQEKFVRIMDELTSKAKSQPLPDIYSIQEVMQNGQDNSLSDRTDRLHFPWKPVDEGAILLPGSVLGLMATQTGQGKSCFAINVALHGARLWNETVVMWQCELTPAEVAVMVAAQVLRKNRNFLTKDDLKEAAKRIGDVQFYVGHSANAQGIMDVLDIMEAAIRRTGATQAWVDNLHYYTTGIDDENRVQAAAMKRIKEIAVRYGTKMGVVFQPRKAQQGSKGKKTHITDVKGSASAGDTADAVLAIHRDLAKGDEEGKRDIYEEKTLAEWLKTRSKGVGNSSSLLHFFGEFASFELLEQNYEEPAA